MGVRGFLQKGFLTRRIYRGYRVPDSKKGFVGVTGFLQKGSIGEKGFPKGRVGSLWGIESLPAKGFPNKGVSKSSFISCLLYLRDLI